MRSALLVDDERLARRELRTLLERAHAAAVRVVGEASSLAAARSLARTTAADLVFLDIHLGGDSGFDLLPDLDPEVAVVFVTAYDRHAVRAFEVNAVDYLLKPVAPERLAQTLDRLAARDARAAPNDDAGPAGALTYDDRLFLRLDDRMGFLAVRDVAAVVADGDHAVLWLAGGRRARVRKPLREWEARLPDRHFVRIHRSALVNFAAVERVEEWSHAAYRLHIRGFADPLEMSRRYAARVRAQLG